MSEFITGCLRMTIEAGFIPVEPITQLISVFRSLYPKISFSIKVQSAIRIHEKLISGSTNLVFSRSNIFEDFANQYNWHPSYLHLACSDQTLVNNKNCSVDQFFDLPLIDTNKQFPTLKTLLEGSSKSLLRELNDRTPDLICRDRATYEGLVRQGAIGAIAISANESVPNRVRVLDHLLAPVKIGTSLNVRKRTSRDLIDSLFLEFFIEHMDKAEQSA